jgi:glycosyltransferase XagB
MTTLVIAPPLWPFFTALMVHDLWAGLPSPASALELIEVVLWMSAALFGTGSILWLALLGMKRRKLLGLWPFLPLLPLYYLLTSAAAWLAIYDLILRPYHWHKTEHGLAKTSWQAVPALAAKAPAVRAALPSGEAGSLFRARERLSRDRGSFTSRGKAPKLRAIC